MAQVVRHILLYIYFCLFVTLHIGLGLSIAKKLIGLHEGHIEVSSVVDKGSTFTIKLPAKLIIKDSPQMISLCLGLKCSGGQV